MENKQFTTPFRAKILDEERKEPHGIQSLRLNKQDVTILKQCGKLLEEEKTSSTIKKLMYLGASALHEGLQGRICQTLFKKREQNKRLGILIEQFEDEQK